MCRSRAGPGSRSTAARAAASAPCRSRSTESGVGHGCRLRRRRLGVLPHAHRRDRTDRPGHRPPGDRGEHPPHPGDLAGGAADAPGVRLRDPRLRLRARRRGHGRPDRLRGPRVARPVGAPGGGHRRPGGLLHGRPGGAAHRDRLPHPGDERSAEPGLPLLRDPLPRGDPRVPGHHRAGRCAVTLPAPNLDDRRFQDLVDDAKRYVQTHCPQWTDHNVSDPGVTLIETFAMVTDQLFYRLNRVPDRLYVRFLELLGLTFVRPAPATTEVTFWLSAPQQEVVRVPAGSEVATRRTSVDEAIHFETTEDLPIVPCAMAALAVRTEDAGGVADRTDDWRVGTAVPAFSAVPVADDALLVGLSDAVPRCAVTLRL